MASKSEKETKEALESLSKVKRYANSIRGKFILSQALTIAIKHLKKLEKRKDMFPKYGEHAQPSNRADMEYLKKELYPLYDVVPRSREALHEWGIVRERESDNMEEMLDGEPTTADEYNVELEKDIKNDLYGIEEFGGDTGIDADYYDENSEKFLKASK